MDKCVEEAFDLSALENRDVTESPLYKSLMKQPGRIVVPNVEGYGDVLKTAVVNLKQDGCILDMYCNEAITFPTKSVARNPETLLGKALKNVALVMKKVDHALYKGDIYRKAPEGTNRVPYFYCLINTYLMGFP